MNKCLKGLTQLPADCDDPYKLDFRNLLHLVFTEILEYEPPAGIIYDVADYMQNLPMSEDGKSRGQIQCQRLAGKSIVVGIFIVWLLYCNPNLKVAVICSTDDFAQRMVKFVRTLLDSHDLLHHLAPNKAAVNQLEDFRKDQLDNEKMFV